MNLFRILPNLAKRKPVIVVPGLFGSMGNDIVPGTGNFDFGPSDYAYRPLIENLEAMGYQQNKDLFISFYDWRKENINSVKNYLIPTIKKAKEISGANKVNLICHSMGGLVARSYIQSSNFQYDVDTLIMLATPNSGAVNAYYFWSGGQIPYMTLDKSIFYKFMWEGYLWVHKILYGERNDIRLLHRLFPSVKELLPSFDYGNYLFYQIDKDYTEFKPIDKMSEKNDFLNNLNRNKWSIYQRGVNIYSIVGEGFKTNKYLKVVRNKYNSERWKDGQPISTVVTDLGDGTVTSKSASSLYGKIITLNSNHMNLLKSSGDILSKILRVPYVNRKNNKNGIEENVYSILARDVEGITIKINNKTNVLEDKVKVDSKEIISRKIGETNYWVILKLKEYRTCELTLTPCKEKKGRVVIYSDLDEAIQNVEEKEFDEQYLINFEDLNNNKEALKNSLD